MKLLHALRRPVAHALATVDSAPARHPDRARLKAAIAARNQAQRTVVESRETLERLESVVRVSDEAARTAADAMRKANDFRKAWVRQGCRHTESHELQELTDAAAEASRLAGSASVNADAVQQELARARDHVGYQQSEIRDHEDEVSAAIGEILVAEARPLLERFERAAEQYRGLRAEVICLERLLATSKYEPKQAANSGVINATLEHATIQSWDKERENPQARDYLNRTHHEDDWLEGLMAPWRARAAALRGDPDA
jgi:hypothetical protein